MGDRRKQIATTFPGQPRVDIFNDWQLLDISFQPFNAEIINSEIPSSMKLLLIPFQIIFAFISHPSVLTEIR